MANIKLTTATKTSWAPLNIHYQSKMQVVVKHFGRVGCTHSLNALFTNARRTSSMKTILNKNFTFKHNRITNIWNQTYSTILSDKRPLSTNNITFCKNLFCMSWSFGKGFGKKITHYKTWGYSLTLSCRFTIMMRPRMSNNLLSKLLKQKNMVLLHMFCHG
jgi:hypothetical protein